MMRRVVTSVFLALAAVAQGWAVGGAVPVVDASEVVRRAPLAVEKPLARPVPQGVVVEDVPVVKAAAKKPIETAAVPGTGQTVTFHNAKHLKPIPTPVANTDHALVAREGNTAAKRVDAQRAVTALAIAPVVLKGEDLYVPGTLRGMSVPVGLKTALVVAAPVVSDTVDVTETDVVSATEALTEAVHEEAAHEGISETKVVVRGPVVFPPKDGHYGDVLADMLQATAEAPEDSRRLMVARENLALFYMVWERPEEAMGVLASLPHREDGLPQDGLFRLMYGIATVAAHRDMTPAQMAAVFDEKGPLKPHAQLWHAVALAQAEDYAGALAMWPKQRGLLPVYPAYLREMAQQAQIATMVTVGDKEQAMKTVDALVAAYGPEHEAEAEGGKPEGEAEGVKEEPKAEAHATVAESSNTVPLALVRWQGVARMGTPREFEGLKYLAKAAENTQDPVTAYKAKFDFVQALKRRKEISDDQAVDYLTRLGLEWRGDSLERDVLKSLADIYDKQATPREALTTWRTLVKAYPTMPDMAAITNRMTETFLRAFDPENPKTYDNLTYLGLYFDFRELVPNDARGDALYEQVAGLLNDLTLEGRAAPLLEQQLHFRPLDTAAQGRLSLMLGRAYRNVGRSGDGLQTLDKYAKAANTTVLSRDWKREEARLLLDLERPKAAADALASAVASGDDDEARRLMIDAYWAPGQASDTVVKSIALLEKEVAGVVAEALVSDTTAQLAVFRLGYAYGQARNAAGLSGLVHRYATALAQLPSLSDGLGAVAASSGVSATIPQTGGLAPIATALNDLNGLTARVKTVRKGSQVQNEGIEEFNKKMRYMELLPPPAL